jgi:hypothetical protein
MASTTVKERRTRHNQDAYERMQSLDRFQRAERKDDGKEPFVVAGHSVAIRATVTCLVVHIEKTRSVGAREIPINFNCIHDDSEVYDMTDGREGKLVVHKWLAKKEGLPRAEK